MLKRFIQYYKPHRRLFCLDMGASLLLLYFIRYHVGKYKKNQQKIGQET